MKLLRLCLEGFLCNKEKEYKLNNWWYELRNGDSVNKSLVRVS